MQCRQQRESIREKTEEQILDFGYACIMYMLKEFPSANRVMGNITEISTELLQKEIKLVSPKHNRREMSMGMQTAQGLYDDGKRRDTLLILEKMKNNINKQYNKLSYLHTYTQYTQYIIHLLFFQSYL